MWDGVREGIRRLSMLAPVHPYILVFLTLKLISLLFVYGQIVRCATNSSKEAVKHVLMHMRQCHPDSYNSESVPELFDVLKVRRS